MVDMNSHIPAPVAARKIMNDAVNNAQLQMAEGNRGNVLTIGNYDLQLSGKTCVYVWATSRETLSLEVFDHVHVRLKLACAATEAS